MSDTIAIRIVEAVFDLLAAVPGVAEIAIAPPGEPAKFPALHLFDRGEEVASQDWLSTRARIDLSILGYAAGTGEETWKAARTLDGAVIAALMADQTLGGLATQIEISGLQIEEAPGAKVRTVAFQRSFRIDFSFQTTNPAALGG